MEVTLRSSGFPGEAGPRWPGMLSVPSVVSEKSLEGSIGPSLVADLSWWMDPGHVIKGAPFVMAPPEQSLFSDASLHGWGAHLGDSLVSTGAEVSRQPPGDDGCFLGSAVLSAGSLGHSGVS
ncbi:hypothetical protein E2C01_044390 [Portunus trituberculatus]|uniref:Uncharacterized protein n=1 Tax=Portunus trituberculatus TaxID=210409 RepID=A0A5B7FT02_PORTR|nr:hypothetical protein [Portunus trituberculatus]